MAFVGWGIFNMYEILDLCSDETNLFKYGFIGCVVLVGFTIVLFCCYYYYRTQRHWKKRRKLEIAKNYQEQQLKVQDNRRNNNNNNINPNNRNNMNNVNMRMGPAAGVVGAGAAPAAAAHLADESLPYELEFEEGGEGGGGAQPCMFLFIHILYPFSLHFVVLFLFYLNTFDLI